MRHSPPSPRPSLRRGPAASRQQLTSPALPSRRPHSYIFPDAWEKYVEPIPEEERGDMMAAYRRKLTGKDKEEQLRAAKAWTTWEMSTSTLLPPPVRGAAPPAAARLLAAPG